MKKSSLLFPFFLLYIISSIGQENIAIKKAVEAIAIEDNYDHKLHDLNKIDGIYALHFEFYFSELEYGTILSKTIYDDISESNNAYFINKIFNYFDRFNNNLEVDLKDKFLLYNGIIVCSGEGITDITLNLVDENNYGFDASWTRATNGITYTYDSNNYKKEKIVFQPDLKIIKKARKQLKKLNNK